MKFSHPKVRYLLHTVPYRIFPYSKEKDKILFGAIFLSPRLLFRLASPWKCQSLFIKAERSREDLRARSHSVMRGILFSVQHIPVMS